MSSSTSNFNDLRVPLAAIFVGASLVVIYHIVIVTFKVQPGWVVSPCKLNEVMVERYSCSDKPAYIVAIGSSLLNRPASQIKSKTFENLCLKGYCALEGASIIEKTHRYPKLLLIELGHTLETRRRYDFEEDVPAYRRALARVTPVVLTQYQPASLLVRRLQEWQYPKPAARSGSKIRHNRDKATNSDARQTGTGTNTNDNTMSGKSIAYDIKFGTLIDSSKSERTKFNTVNDTNIGKGTDFNTSTSKARLDRTAKNTAHTTTTVPEGDKDNSTHSRDNGSSYQAAGRIDIMDPSFLPPPHDSVSRKVREDSLKHALIDKQVKADPRRPESAGSGQLPTAQRMSPMTRKMLIRNMRKLRRYVQRFEKHGVTVCFVSVPQSPAYMDSPRAAEHSELFDRFFPRTRYKRVEWTGAKRYWYTSDGSHLTDEEAEFFARFLMVELAPIVKNIERNLQNRDDVKNSGLAE